MTAISPKCICITCRTYEVNPVLNDGTNKSFCSHICEELWLRSDLQYLSMEALQRIALKKLSDIVRKNGIN